MMKDSRVVKRLGYLTDQKGIINRYLREGGAWDTHLLRSKEYIKRAVGHYKPEVVTILGSGWLLDVPLEELVETVNTINLVDINHPRQIRARVEKMGNVNLITSDVTGGLMDVIWQKRKRSTLNLDEISIPIYNPEYNTGLIISLNLLTQLDMLLFEFLTEKVGLNPDECLNFRKRVQERHIEFLKSRESILITEVKESVYKDKVLISNSNLLFTKFPAGTNIEKWEWIFDTRGLYYSGKKVVFNVKAIEILDNGKS